MELTIKSQIEEYKYLITPDIAKFLIGYFDSLDSENGLVVKIKGENLLENEYGR